MKCLQDLQIEKKKILENFSSNYTFCEEFRVDIFKIFLKIGYPIFALVPTHPYQIISDFEERTQSRISDFLKLTHPNP